jgi:hypothetical protein
MRLLATQRLLDALAVVPTFLTALLARLDPGAPYKKAASGSHHVRCMGEPMKAERFFGLSESCDIVA